MIKLLTVFLVIGLPFLGLCAVMGTMGVRGIQGRPLSDRMSFED